MSTNPSIPNHDSKPLPALGAGVLLLAWLIPGYAFWHQGLKHRAGFLFGVLQGTFLLGCLLRGSVTLPDLQGGADGFNIVAILVFLVQLGNGGLALISALPEFLGTSAAILPTNEAHAYADLGQMFLLVSGGMNYFLVMAAVGEATHGGQTVPTSDKQGSN